MEIISYSDEKLKNQGYDFSLAKKQFSNVGMACFVMEIVLTALVTIASVVVAALDLDLDKNATLFWIINFVPNYVIAMPICIFMLNRKEQMVPEKSNLGTSGWFKFFTITFAMLFIGNFIASIVSSIIDAVSGVEVQNAVADLALSDNVIVKSIIMAIVAPIMEEYVFRKKVIDSLYAYGEKRAILISALIFGAIHGNISQMFYAFTLGLVFGYIYIKTGKIRYTISFHIIVNFMGGVIAPWIITQLFDTSNGQIIDSSNMQTIDSSIIQSIDTFSVLIFTLYTVIIFVLFVVGLVLLIKGRKNISFKETPLEIPGEKTYKITILNVGMILFLAVCLLNVIKDLLL